MCDACLGWPRLVEMEKIIAKTGRKLNERIIFNLFHTTVFFYLLSLSNTIRIHFIRSN